MGGEPVPRIWQSIGVLAWGAVALLWLATPAASQDAVPEDMPRQAVAAFQPLPPLSVPQPPAGIAAAKAYAVLQTACARCHQAPRSEGPTPAGNLGNILDLAALAREPSLVVPGMPDASPLYVRMLDRHRPETMFSGAHEADLTLSDTEVIRDWITELPRNVRSCSNREPLSQAELTELMTGWLLQAGEAARETRFVSLAHLYNSCATDLEMTAWREAVAKLLNSLSWAPVPARVETIGDKLALLAVRISDLGWVGAHWDRLSSREPVGGAPRVEEAVREAAGAQRPVVRADWLASAATRPPLLHELLGLPKRLAEVGRIVGGDTIRRLGTASPDTVAVAASAETGAARVVQRQETRHGALWLAEGSSTTGGTADGKHKSPPDPAATGPDGARRLLFNLPNGLIAFAAFAADGNRVDAPLPEIGTGGCLACHAGGLAAFGPQGAGDGSPGTLARGFADDNFRYRRALVQAGVDPDRMLGGLEIVTALARRYEVAVDLERAAREVGMSSRELSARLEKVEGPERPLALRLMQGRLSREQVERLMAVVHGDAERPRTAPAQVTALGDGAIDLGLWSDSPRHKSGDLITFHVTTSASCHLTLVSVDTKGQATVLFPNEFEPDNAIRPGAVVRIPSDNAPYQLRVSSPGVESAIALCNATARRPAGITPDYERQRFTVLGNWRNFLAGERSGVNDDPRDLRRPARRQVRSGRREPRKEAPPPPDDPTPTARAAISVIVE